MHGDLMPIKFRELRQPELEGYLTEILTRNQGEHFAKGNDLDFSYVSAEGGRFRVNVFRKDTGIGATFRAIPTEVPTLEKLALPPIVTKLCDYHQGMVLVTGSTGTGKSTTLAAMIDHLNQTRRLNIISLEDPIEFVHRSKNSQVIQRELGTHIPSFAEGVRAAMREDPDVILVGELRDAETITMAMTAAETGHLVLGTLHTTSAVKTIDRIIDALPVEEREQTKSFLAQSLLAVVTQVLVKTLDARGRKAICEVLMMTKAVAKLIQAEQSHQIPTQMQMGRDLGMSLLDQSLLTAIAAREIDPDDAYVYAMDKKPFQKYVTDTSMLPKVDLTGPIPPRNQLHRHPRESQAWRRLMLISPRSWSSGARICISSRAIRRGSGCSAI
jgi:twitching motility protein PilT